MVSRSRSYFMTDSQSVSISWYRAPLWDLRPDIISCWNVAVWNLRSCIYWAPSVTRWRVCNLQCNHSIVWVAKNPKPYFAVSPTQSISQQLKNSQCCTNKCLYICQYNLDCYGNECNTVLESSLVMKHGFIIVNQWVNSSICYGNIHSCPTR
jgi:hypothetical protein